MTSWQFGTLIVALFIIAKLLDDIKGEIRRLK
jgi:hypothetical protein